MSVPNPPDPATTEWVPLWPLGAQQVSAEKGFYSGDLVWSVLTTRPGAVLCDGGLYDSVADPTFSALFSAIGTTYGGTGASNFAVPDVRGRLLVCKGTHADVDVLGDNDGIAVANRTPKHNSTNGLSFAGTGGNTGTVSSDHSHAVSGTTAGRNAAHNHADSGHGHAETSEGGAPGDGQWWVARTQGGSGLFYPPPNGVGMGYANLGYESADHAHTFSAQTGGISANHSHAFTPAGTIGGIVGPGGTRPADTPSYIVENCFIIK